MLSRNGGVSPPPTRRLQEHPGRRAVLLGGAASLVGGCSFGTKPTLSSEDTGAASTDAFGAPTRATLLAMFERKAAAFKAGDEQAFLADLDPGNAKLVAWQRSLFRNLRQFDVASFALVPSPVETRGTETYVAEVAQLVRLTADVGPDGVSGCERFEYRFVLRGGRWLVQEIFVAEGGHPAPWTLSELSVTRAGNVYLAGDRTATNLSAFAAAAPTEVRRVEKLWGARPHFPGYVLFFSRDLETLGRWYERPGAPDKTVSRFDAWVPWADFADADAQPYKAEAQSAARVVVNLANLDKAYSAAEAPATIRHELTHAITARTEPTPGVGFDVCRWVVEGFARFVEYAVDPSLKPNQLQWVRAGVRRGWFTGSPPDSADFYDAGRIHFNYPLASTVFLYVSERKGLAAAVDFYDQAHRFLDGTTEGVPYLTSKAFDGVCRSVMGVTAKTFLSQWSGYVRSL